MGNLGAKSKRDDMSVKNQELFYLVMKPKTLLSRDKNTYRRVKKGNCRQQ